MMRARGIVLERNIRTVCFAILLFMCLCAMLGCSSAESFYRGEGLCTVHYLDVGQSDCTFVEIGGEYTLMIDASDTDHADDVCEYVRSLGYGHIDILFLTHPHSDHIGGAAEVLSNFSVGAVYMTDCAGTGAEYEALLEAINDNGVSVAYASRGVSFTLGKASGRVISPGKTLYEDENDNSAVLRLCYGARSFIFMGDCTEEAESVILKSGEDVSADVIKVGHHGSNGSSSSAFIDEVGCEFAVISCSEDNDYGHPSPYVIDRFSRAGAEVFATYSDSDIVAVTDGELLFAGRRSDTEYFRRVCFDGTFTYDETESKQTQDAVLWVLNCDSHVIHKYGSYCVGKIDEDDAEQSSGEIEWLEAEGYEKCKVCFGK